MSKKDLPIITKTQLSLRNGQDKPEIWIALDNKVYDVTNSKLWKNGKHYEHWAGQSLDDEIGDAPHTKEIIKRFEILGILEN